VLTAQFYDLLPQVLVASHRFQVRKIGLRTQRQKFESLFSLVRDLPRWSAQEKQLLKRFVQAKNAAEETTYLKLMQRHERLRREIISLGS
jgi:hypothetical protein